MTYDCGITCGNFKWACDSYERELFRITNWDRFAALCYLYSFVKDRSSTVFGIQMSYYHFMLSFYLQQIYDPFKKSLNISD